MLLIIAILVLIVVFIFPIIFKPDVEPPAKTPFGSPSSVAVRLANQDLMPLMDVEYTCEVSKLTLANGSEVGGAKVLIRGTIRKLPGRKAVALRCEAAYLVTTPIKTAEYTVTLNYRNYPWPRRRTSIYHIAAQIDSNGHVTGWKLVSG